MNELEKQEVEEQFPDPKINKILDRKVIEYQDENNKVLDWRNNNKDSKTLIDWWEYNVQLTENYLNRPCPSCGDPIRVCNENPDTNHYELVVNDEGKVIGETERMFKGKKMGGVKTEAKSRDSKLKLKKEEKKDMFNLSEFKPDADDKHYTTHQCLSQNAIMFLELASEKAFELLDGHFDNDDEALEELKFLFAETKTSLLASEDARSN